MDRSQFNISCFKQHLSEILRDFHLNGVHQSPEQSPWHFCIDLVSFDTSFMLSKQYRSPCLVHSAVTELNLINGCFDINHHHVSFSYDVGAVAFHSEPKASSFRRMFKRLSNQTLILLHPYYLRVAECANIVNTE